MKTFSLTVINFLLWFPNLELVKLCNSFSTVSFHPMYIQPISCRKKEMLYCSSQSSLMHVPIRSSLEEIVYKRHGRETSITARDSPVDDHSQATKLFTQLDLGSDKHKNGLQQLIEVVEQDSSRFELQHLLVNELNHIGVISTKKSCNAGHRRNPCGDL